MQELIERARRQAMDARERANEAEDRGVEQEWLTLAVVFEELAHEYEQVSRIVGESVRAA